MTTRIYSDPKAFLKLEEFVKPHEAVGRTASASFLIWFLQTIYRFDEVEAQDAVCDRKLDAGIDAISVLDDQQEIVIFQAKRKEKLPGTLGDTDLKEFTGSLAQFGSEETVRRLEITSRNIDLLRLLSTNEVASKIGRGYKVRPIFVANVAANSDAYNYLQIAKEAGTEIDLWDLTRLGPVLEQLSKEWFVDEKIRLNLANNKLFLDGSRMRPRLLFAAIQAKELVRIPGIADTRVFAQNVRLSLGKTRVNNEILESVKNKGEHGNFLAFHNGLTIVAKEFSVRGQTLTMNKYSVCNGCQSLITFYNNRSSLTDNLEVLVRVVQVGEDRKLSEYIAYRTNNQNAISLRDLSANDSTQVQIKTEFDQLFGNEATYGIKRSDLSSKTEISNEYAGQILLALYTRQPWNAHQKYRVFGNLEGDIFNYKIGAPQVRLAQLIMQVVQEELGAIAIETIRKYGLTKFIVIYLVGEVLRKEAHGVALLEDPLPYLSTATKTHNKQENILQQIRAITHFVITDLNYYVEERVKTGYDYKTAFKSPAEVSEIRAEILRGYDKDKYNNRITAFHLPKDEIS